MILRASDVADLQYVLMDSVRRYGATSGMTLEMRDDLLASAAALDYALLLSSENGDEPFDGAAPVAATLRDTMTRAAISALDFATQMLRAPKHVLEDFLEHHARESGLFDVLRSLRGSGVLTSDEVSFRALTLANDLRDRN
jgi:hypothetical protein